MFSRAEAKVVGVVIVPSAATSEGERDATTRPPWSKSSKTPSRRNSAWGVGIRTSSLESRSAGSAVPGVSRPSGSRPRTGSPAGLVGGGDVGHRPQQGGQLSGGSHSPDLQIAGGGQGEAVGDTEIIGGGAHGVLPRVSRHIHPVVDGGPALIDQTVPESVACRSTVLGDGEGNQVPVPVPALAGPVLSVGGLVALHRRAPEVVAPLGGSVRRLASGSLPLQESLGDQATQARPHLLGGVAAGFGHVVQLGSIDRSIGSDHSEHQDSGRYLYGRDAHDRNGHRPIRRRQDGVGPSRRQGGPAGEPHRRFRTARGQLLDREPHQG